MSKEWLGSYDVLKYFNWITQGCRYKLNMEKGKINYLGAVISKAELYHDEEKLNGAKILL
jgi:hypothetical protein